MARTQKIYKVDTDTIASEIALAQVVKDTTTEAMIIGFCKKFSIPLNVEKIAENKLAYQQVAARLAEQDRLKAKK